MRNIDHLAFAPSPALVFHPFDGWQPAGGINTGLMILQPSRAELRRLLQRTAALPPLQVGDGSDQAAWAHHWNSEHAEVFELPTGYNFRSGQACPRLCERCGARPPPDRHT